MNDGIGSESARILAAQRMEAQAAAIVGAVGRTPAARADAARRVATGEARALLDAAQAIYWGVVEAHDRQIRGFIGYLLHHPRARGWDGDDLAQVVRVGWMRGVRRWRPGTGAAPVTAGRWGARAWVQRSHLMSGDLSEPRCGNIGWQRRAEAAVRLDDAPNGRRALRDRLMGDADPERAALLAQAWGALDGLPERDARVIRSFYGGATDREIAAEEGVSHQRIGQIRDRALARLRAAMGWPVSDAAYCARVVGAALAVWVVLAWIEQAGVLR